MSRNDAYAALFALGCLLLMFSSTEAYAQTRPVPPPAPTTMEPPSSSPPEAAGHHAPAIWLAQGEPFYPMLPHPFAFDGIDNDGDGCVDLSDPDEVGVMADPKLNSKGGAKGRLEDLLAVFGRLLDVRQCVERGNPLDRCVQEFDPRGDPPTGGPGCRATRLFKDFNVCGRLWGTGGLRCGPPPAVLFGTPQIASGLAEIQDNRGDRAQTRTAPVLMGIQYWMHYPWDAGHLNDGEHVSVFYWSVESSLAADVKAVVGAGHDAHTANNVLFASTSPSSDQIAPRRLPPHLPFLVELGKHASAPDLNCDGQFEVGVDANDGPQGAWGSRDSMVSIKKKIIGPFQGWMSYERDGSGLMIADVNDDQQWLNACPEFTRGRAIIEAILKGDHPERGVAVSDHRYRLLDANAFVELDEKLKTGFDDVARFLHDNRRLFWDAGAAPPSVETCGTTRSPGCIAPEVWEQLQNWLTTPNDARHRRDMWTHDDFWKPGQPLSDDFKRNLSPRFSFGIAFQSVGGNGSWGPAVKIAGVGPMPDSSLELSAAFDGTSSSTKNDGICDPCLTDIVATYNLFRTSYTGFFVGGGYHRKGADYRQVEVVDDTGATTVVIKENPGRNFFVFAGVALSAQLPDKLGSIKIRFLPRGAWKRSRIALRIGVQTSIQEGNTTDPGIYHSRSFAQLRVGASWTFGFSPGKHPLAR